MIEPETSGRPARVPASGELPPRGPWRLADIDYAAIDRHLVAGDTTPITNDNTDYHGKVTNQVTTANVAKQATADLGISRTNAEKHARALAKRIKAHPAYTAAFGNLLGIVGPEDTTDISTLKPQITGEDKKGGVVEIDFNLANSEGVNI